MKIYLSPSSADRWLTCTMSPKFIADNDFKPPPSKWASQGTDAHQLAADKIEHGTPIKIDPKDQQTLFANQYADLVLSLPLKTRLIEQKVPNFYGLGNSILDCVGYYNTNLYICDFKSGWTLVRAENNNQLKIYALNALKSYGWMFNIEQVDMQICQPSRKNYDTECVTKNQLEEYKTKVMDTVDDIKRGVNLQFNPSEKACQWCPARQLNKCKAYMDWAIGVKK